MNLKHPKLVFIALNIAVVGIVLFIVVTFTLGWMNRYTQHDQFIVVPAFQALTQQEADSVAKAAGLRITVIDSVYDEKSAPATIVEQYPLNGEHVKTNRMIYLTINAQSPELVSAPAIKNAPFRQTMQVLKSKGFNIGNLHYVPSEFKNLVIHLQYKGELLEPGTLLRKGTTIDIVLGNGNSNKNDVPLPTVAGMKLNQAINLLKENFLNIENIEEDESIQNHFERVTSIVYKQSPDPATQLQIEAGSRITLYITQDKEKIQSLDSLMVIQ